MKNKRYTPAVRRVTHGDTASGVLAEFLGLVDDFEFDVKAVSVDRECYDGTCLTLMQAHNHAYVMPIVKWGPKIQTELSTGWSRESEHDLTMAFDGHEHYSKRFGIEATSRLSESSLISTTTQDSTRRLLFVVLSLLMQNVWRRMGTRAAWNALSVRRESPANKLPDDRFTR